MTIQEKANQAVVLLSTRTEFFGVTNQMMAIKLYSPVEMFVMLFKFALIFEYKNKILRCIITSTSLYFEITGDLCNLIGS